MSELFDDMGIDPLMFFMMSGLFGGRRGGGMPFGGMGMGMGMSSRGPFVFMGGRGGPRPTMYYAGAQSGGEGLGREADNLSAVARCGVWQQVWGGGMPFGGMGVCIGSRGPFVFMGGRGGLHTTMYYAGAQGISRGRGRRALSS